MADTKLYRVRLILDTGVPGDCAAIEHDGALWLVPAWLPFPDEGYTKPERMIPLAKFDYRATGRPEELNLLITDQVPSTLLFGPISSSMRQLFGVLERPDIKLRTGGTLN
jgi:hypothetical protein